MPQKPVFSTDNKPSNEVLKLCANGDVYHRGKLLTKEDIEKILAILQIKPKK